MDQLFKKLRKFEEQIDKMALKKYLQYEEQHNARLKCTKRLRIFLKIRLVNGNLHLRLDGRVINDYKNIVETRMSELLKRVCVIFNENIPESKYTLDDISSQTYEMPSRTAVEFADNLSKQDENLYEWVNNGNKIDALEIREKYIPRSIKIILDFDNSKDLVKLSDSLQGLLKIHTASRTTIFIEFWKYIRLNDLINFDGSIKCDARLKSIFKSDLVLIDQITDILEGHFLPIDFFVFNVPVRDYERIFDINIERDDLTDFPIIYKDRSINIVEKKIQTILENIELTNARRETLERYLADPLKFYDEFMLIDNGYLDFMNPKNGEGVFWNCKVQEIIYEMLKNIK